MNFTALEADIKDITFITGPNASGKTNFLDSIKFLLDISRSGGGGLQYAASKRGGLAGIKRFNTRSTDEVQMKFCFQDELENTDSWKYSLSFNGMKYIKDSIIISEESIHRNDETLLSRPDKEDKDDYVRLTQTYLQQTSQNKLYRSVSQYLGSSVSLNFIPEIVKYPGSFMPIILNDRLDQFGGNILFEMRKATDDLRNKVFSIIDDTIRLHFPQFEELQFYVESGEPHLSFTVIEGKKHYTINESKMPESILTIIVLLWVIYTYDSIILFETPERYMHSQLFCSIINTFESAREKRHNQLIISTNTRNLVFDCKKPLYSIIEL
jgi:predicted ATPase